VRNEIVNWCPKVTKSLKGDYNDKEKIIDVVR